MIWASRIFAPRVADARDFAVSAFDDEMIGRVEVVTDQTGHGPVVGVARFALQKLRLSGAIPTSQFTDVVERVGVGLMGVGDVVD